MMKSSILQNKVIRDVADIFNIDPRTLNGDVAQQNVPNDAYFPDNYIDEANYYGSSQNSVSLFTNLSKHEKAERALLKHFMNDKDLFLNYQKQLENDDFTNNFFKRIFNILQEFYAENDQYIISDIILYTDNDDLREALITLDNYDMNEEPYDSEIEDYLDIINESKFDTSIEELNHKLREATRIGDIELQKYYLQQIVNKNKQRM